MSVNRENTAYRKGVILGLTMAEIMILVIFLLLLAFATILNKEQEKTKELLALASKNNKYVERILKVTLGHSPDITEELVRAIENLPKVIQLVKKNNLIEGDHEEIANVILRGVDRLRYEKKLKEVNGDIPIEERLKQAVQKQVRLESEVSNLTGQNKRLIKQIKDSGKGVDYPPCWVSSKGKPEYIYNTYLTSDGIIIRDNNLPNRINDKENLPVSKIVYNKPLGTLAFLQQTSSLLKWSKNHDCRFFVRVYDKTDANDKKLYKDLLEAVEGSFYKNLM